MVDIIRTETLSPLFFLLELIYCLVFAQVLMECGLSPIAFVIAAEVSLFTNYTHSDCLVSVNFHNGIQLCACFVYIFITDAILSLLPFVKQNICEIVESLLPA